MSSRRWNYRFWKRWILPVLIFFFRVSASDDARIINVERSQQQQQHQTQQQQQQQQQYQTRRKLAVGDFEELNDIIYDAVIVLPDASLSEEPYGLELKELKCTNFQIGDIIVSSRKPSIREVITSIELYELGMACTARYRFEGLLFVYRGDVSIDSDNNQAILEGSITSSNYNEVPPTSLEVTKCNPTVNIDRIDFDNGGLLAFILDRFERMLRTLFERVAEERICTELETVMEQKVGIDLLRTIKDILDEYDTSSLILNPLLSEIDMINNMNQDPSLSDITLLNLQQRDDDEDDDDDDTNHDDDSKTTTTFGNWMNILLQEAVEYLRAEVPDDNNVMKNDMQANILLRNLFLDGDRALRINMDDFRYNDGIIYSGHDRLTETTITIDMISLMGLDTLINFDPIDIISNYTLQNQLSWEYLAFHIQATIEIKPSTLEDSFIEHDDSSSTSSSMVYEQIDIYFGMDDIKAISSILLAIDKDLIYNVRLGSLLQKENILYCLIATVFRMEVSMLSVQVGNIQIPTLDGFVSNGIDRVVSNAVRGIFLMYETLLLNSSPAFCQYTIRELLNKNLLVGAKPQRNIIPLQQNYEDDDFTCFASKDETSNEDDNNNNYRDNIKRDGIIDFRDLLLVPEEAILIGGRGNSPYGNLFSTVIIPTFENNILDITNINSMINSFTQKQSGYDGTLYFPSILFQYDSTNNTLNNNGTNTTVASSSTTTHLSVLWDQIGTIVFTMGDEIMEEDGIIQPLSAFNDDKNYNHNNRMESSLLWDQIQLIVSNSRMYNLDIVTSPLSILAPTGWNILSNTVTMGATPSSSSSFVRDNLNMTVRVLVAIEGENSPFQMRNELDLSVSISSLSLSFDIIASMMEHTITELPLGDSANVHCWLASIASTSFTPSSSNNNNIESSNFVAERLAIQNVVFSMSSLVMDSTCISCSSPGGHTISEILHFLDEVGAIFLLKPRLENLVEEYIHLMWESFRIDELLDEAPKLCPHLPTYDKDAATIESNFPGWSSRNIPNLSPEGVETTLAIGFVVLHSALVVIAKNQLLQVENEEEKQSNIHEDNYDSFDNNSDHGGSFYESYPSDTILDWTDLSGTIGNWTENAFDEFRRYIHEVSIVDSQTDFRINHILRMFVLSEDGSLKFMFNGLELLNAAGFMISLTQARIYGLDTISDLDALVVDSRHNFANYIHIDRLRLMFDLNIYTSEDGKTSPMTLSYSLNEISLNLNLMVAMNRKRLGEIELGSILEMDRIFICLLAGIDEMRLSNIDLSVGSIDNPVLEGFFSTEVRDSLSWIVQSVYEEYRSDVIAAIPHIAGSTVRDLLNAILPQFLDTATRQCTPPPDIPRDGLIDFRDLFLAEETSRLLGGQGNSKYGNLIRILFDLVYEKLLSGDDKTGPGINDLLGMWTKNRSNITGAMTFEGDVLNFDSNIRLGGLEADASLVVADVAIRNLNSIGYPIELLKPIFGEGNVLNNSASVGVGDSPLQLGATIILSLSDGAEMQLNNSLDISLNLDAVGIIASFLLRMEENSFVSFPLQDLPNLNCWLATILSQSPEETSRLRGVELLTHTISIRNLTLDIECVSCTSPMFDELLLSLYTPDIAMEALGFIGETIDRLLDSEFLQVFLEQILYDAAKQCPHHPVYNPNTTAGTFLQSPGDSLGFNEKAAPDSKAIYFTIANSTFALCLLLFALICKYVVNRRNRAWIQSLSNEGTVLFHRQQAKEFLQDKILNETTFSLFRSPCIPRKVRLAVPLVILLNIGLYMVGHLGVLSSVDLDVTLAGEAFKVHNFLEFSFIDATRRTYHNGGSEMAILVWIFTGILPYIKLFVSLLVWMLPPSKLSVSLRGRVLLWIDALATLSVVDVFTMIVAVAILLVYAGGPDKSISTEGELYTLKFIVIPHPGAYCIIIAQRMSRVSSRFFLDYHQGVVSTALQNSQYLPEGSQTDRDGAGGKVDDEIEIDERSLSAESPDRTIVKSKNESTPDNAERHSDPQPQTDASDKHIDTIEGSNGVQCCNQNLGKYNDRECSSVVPRGLCSDGPIVTDAAGESTLVDEVDCETQNDDQDDSSTSSVRQKAEYKWGGIGIYFAGLTVVAIFIIGCILAPAISIDTSDVWRLTLESGKTFEEAVLEYGVFAIVGNVLLKARFVLDTTLDYVGLGLLLLVGTVSVGMTFLIQAYHFFRRRIEERRSSDASVFCPLWSLFLEATNHKKSRNSLPSYLRLFKWKHIEIYLISFAIGVWQLGSIPSYAMHLYCDILRRVYAILAYIGLVEYSNINCFRVQATHAGNLTIIVGAFVILVTSFVVQAKAQLQKNVDNALDLIGKEADVERLSSVWHPEDNKHFSTASISYPQTSQDEEALNDTRSLSMDDNEASSLSSPSSSFEDEPDHVAPSNRSDIGRIP